MDSKAIIIAAAILGVSIILAAFVCGGIYEFAEIGVPATYKINKFTGTFTYEYPGGHLQPANRAAAYEQVRDKLIRANEMTQEYLDGSASQ